MNAKLLGLLLEYHTKLELESDTRLLPGLPMLVPHWQQETLETAGSEQSRVFGYAHVVQRDVTKSQNQNIKHTIRTVSPPIRKNLSQKALHRSDPGASAEISTSQHDPHLLGLLSSNGPSNRGTFSFSISCRCAFSLSSAATSAPTRMAGGAGRGPHSFLGTKTRRGADIKTSFPETPAGSEAGPSPPPPPSHPSSSDASDGRLCMTRTGLHSWRGCFLGTSSAGPGDRERVLGSLGPPDDVAEVDPRGTLWSGSVPRAWRRASSEQETR